eukprot:CAMPEP_0185191588 /NCGR_PEP_ID=MMETSP1140-20130426/15762_1 /TAXON_ID=298111 /ORGANISM="Pavlova sp., Strain CCMP459" /LENGTH=294 /DNA_ID=CAMNT_0027758297 /DNA_START=395 /DNA_END=1275 /DNA_ORIENTATION=+
MCLKELQCLCYQVADGHALLLRVVDAVTQVLVVVLEEVEHREYLAVVGNEGLADHLAGDDEILQHLEHGADDLALARVEGGLNGDDELRDDGQDLRPSNLEHVVAALEGKELVRLLLLAQAVKEDGQVVMVVELVNVHLPADAVGPPVVHCNGKVPALVALAELSVGRVVTHLEGARLGGFRLALLHLGGLEQRARHAARARVRLHARGGAGLEHIGRSRRAVARELLLLALARAGHKIAWPPRRSHADGHVKGSACLLVLGAIVQRGRRLGHRSCAGQLLAKRALLAGGGLAT